MTNAISSERSGTSTPVQIRANRTSISNWAGSDLYLGARAWPLWSMLGWNDIRMRYRRSVLGPFWMTLSMAVFVVTLGVIYSTIFHTEIRNYLPYVAVGFITWGFISTATVESCGAFLESEALIKQLKMPFSIFVLRVVWRNCLVLLHTIILIVPIWIIFSVEPKLSMLLALPGLALVFINQVWLGLVVAILSTRFRDVPQIVQTALQVAVFATPIMWPVSTLGSRTIIADVNPAYHLIELVRAPLTGGVPALVSWAVAIGMAVIGLLLAAALLRRASRRIVYWL